MYAIPLNVLEGNLIDNVFRLSVKDLLTSTSINEGVSESLESYYELVYLCDLLSRGRMSLS